MKTKKIDKDLVRHVARLSRLSLSEEDLSKFASQLALILDYVNKLNEIDTKNVIPTSHALSSIKNVFREDKVKKSLTSDEALSNAPKRIDDFFGVPKVI